MLPSYLVVGVKRAGTTTLQHVLAQHPAVLAPGVPKGTRYFDVNHVRGWEWFRSHFPTTVYARLRERLFGTPPITGEASPYYLFHPLALGRIREALPDVRIVVVLRDPVDRAWSHHAYEVARGFEELPFEAALEAEMTRLDGEEDRLRRDPTYVSFAHRHYAYVTRGVYAPQLRLLFDLFPRHRVLVLDHRELFDDPRREIAKVHAFLGLDPLPPAELPCLKPSGAPPIPRRLRTQLADIFASSNAATYALIGRDLRWSG